MAPNSVHESALSTPRRPVAGIDGAMAGVIRRAREARKTLALLWTELKLAGRFALLGFLVSAAGIIFFGTLISNEVARQVLGAEGKGLKAAVAAMEPQLPDVTDGSPLTGLEIQRIDEILEPSLFRAGIRVKLWALDGTVLYSDARGLIGRRYPEVLPTLREAVANGIYSKVGAEGEPEHRDDNVSGRTAEHYVAVNDPVSGAPIAVLESYQDTTSMDAAIAGVETAQSVSIRAGLGLMFAFLGLLLAATVRSTSRQRAAVEGHVREFNLLSSTADTIASSMERTALFAALSGPIRSGLKLDGLAIVAPGDVPPAALRLTLGDGYVMAAERSTPLAPAEEQILRAAARSLDAAQDHTMRFAEVREAAAQRRALIGRLAVAHEEERRRIVGELHDSLAAELIRTLYAVRLVKLQLGGASPDFAQAMDRIEQMVDEAEGRLRQFMSTVRPVALETVDLAVALREVVERFRQESGHQARLEVRGQANRLRPAAQMILVQALEEALLNVRKHAGAAKVRVSLVESTRTVVLTVDDDGRGWPAVLEGGEGRGLGLGYLRERVVAHGGRVVRAESPMGGARLVMRMSLDATAK